MCGFLGEISDLNIKKEQFLDLLNLSKNRGPDQQGYWADNHYQLGFNRLSILDLTENALQPLFSPTKRYIIVFNGEIYNYKELQKDYEIDENDLRSKSDTEIIAHLLDKISIDEMVSVLNGMFSLVIYDLKSLNIFLVRDFAGIKPLYYGIYNEGLVFASQFDQIFTHPKFYSNLKIRPEIFKEFIGLGYMPAPNTVFSDIFQVDPGELICYSFEEKKIIRKFKYFKWNQKNSLPETKEDTIEQFESVFNYTVNKQLNSDVPIATFLSGGIDSPLVSIFAKKNYDKIKAFTFRDEKNVMDESEIAKKIAFQTQIPQVIESVNESDLLSLIQEHTDLLTEPMGDFSSIPTFIITKKAKKYATVMLSGDGGDELFWGYPRFIKSLKHFYWFKIPLTIRKIIVPIIRKIIPDLSYALEDTSKIGEWILEKQIYFSNINVLFPNVDFSQELKELYKVNSVTKREFIDYLKRNEFYGHLQRVLRKVDLMSMANSIEVRVPFLDKHIIEFSNNIKTEYGFKHKIPKYILRKSLQNYVDKELTSLPKKGFSIPLYSYLMNDLKEEVKYFLSDIPFYGSEFINIEYLNKLIEDYMGNNKFEVQQIWNLYIWQKWAFKYKLVQK